MAAPALARAAASAAKKQFSKALGRTVYRDARGKFVSYAKYQSLRTKARQFEIEKMQKWGKPPAGWTWTRIANKYPDRFAGYT